MKKLYNQTLKTSYYKEVLDNGLTVYLFHEPQKVKTTCAFGTPYGGYNIYQRFDGKDYSFNPGVAHFLEHKLFETDEKNIMEDFTRIGANVNAFTSYYETVYYFTTSSNDIETPLNMLLDFTQSFSVTKESVDKEKGIICEEIDMYMQEPINKLLNETYKVMYLNSPLIFDIGGDSKSVNKITKEELELCYKINYHPSNMILVISSNKEPNEILDVIKNNQKNKQFTKVVPPITIKKEEPIEVNKKEYSFSMPISKNKQVIAYKIDPSFKDNEDANYQEKCLSIALDACLSPMNKKYQEWLDNDSINDFFGYEIDYRKDSAYVMFYIENDNPNVLDNLLKEALDIKNINDEVITQIKRRMTGMSIFSLNDNESFVLDFTRKKLEGIDFFKEFDDFNKIKLIDVEKSLEFVNKSSKTVVNLRK